MRCGHLPTRFLLEHILWPTESRAGAHCVMDGSQIERLLDGFCTEAASLEPTSSVERLATWPSADVFRAEYVERSRPCVIASGAASWPAVRTWSLQSLVDDLGDTPVTCTFTPDGAADAVKLGPGGTHAFVLPHTESRSLRSFADVFWRTQRDGIACVPSVQFQNSNMAEFPGLADALPLDAAWARRAFDAQAPDAHNIWIGDRRSTTSFHKVCSLCRLLHFARRASCTRTPAPEAL